MVGGVRFFRSLMVIAGLAAVAPASVTAQVRGGPVERPPPIGGPNVGGVGGVPGGLGQTPLGSGGLSNPVGHTPSVQTGPNGLGTIQSPGPTEDAAEDTSAEVTSPELQAAAEQSFEALLAGLPIVDKARTALRDGR